MKFTNKTLFGMIAGLIVLGGSPVVSLGQAKPQSASVHTQAPLSIEKALEFRQGFRKGGPNYSQALKALQAIARDAHQKHNTKLEAEAVHEIKKTIALQGIYVKFQGYARREIEAGRLSLVSFGMPRIDAPMYDEILSKEYHIKSRPGYGCVLSYEDEAKLAGFNGTMEAEIERRYGKDIYEKVRERATKEYRNRFRTAALAATKGKRPAKK